jgi:DNA-binding HxlR family transcriptional regulator
VKRKSLDGSICFIARSLDQVGEWWSLMIIRDLFVGNRRFGELLESLGVARNILSVRLKRLVSCGIVQLRPAADGPHQEYELTAKGRGLFVTLVALEQWGRRWVDPESDVPYVYVERATGQEIAPVEVRSRDGRKLSSGDLAVVLRPPTQVAEDLAEQDVLAG